MTVTEETDLKSSRDALLMLQQELSILRGYMINAKQDYNYSWWNPDQKIYLRRFSQYSQQYKQKKATYDQLLSEYNQKVAFYNQEKSSKDSIVSNTPIEKSIATPPPVRLESSTGSIAIAEVPDTKGTIQEVVSNQKPKQVVVSKPRPKLAPTIVINDDNMGELDDDLELNDVLIDDDLELNDTPVVGVGDAGVSYNGTVYRMPTEVAAGVSTLKESGGTGTLSKNVKYSGDTGKVLIRKGNWRKNPYVIKENDGTTYKTNNLEKFLQHIAALEAE